MSRHRTPSPDLSVTRPDPSLDVSWIYTDDGEYNESLPRNQGGAQCRADNVPHAEVYERLRAQVQEMDMPARRQLLQVAREGIDMGERAQAAHAVNAPVPSSGRLRKLKPFSGAKEIRSDEVDYATWRLHVVALVADPQFRDPDKKRLIVNALNSPALEIALSISSVASAAGVLDVLDQHFGEVADGYELYAQFRTCVQEMKESSSEFLQKIHLLALRCIRRHGMLPEMLDMECLRQFEAGCADEDIILRVGVRDLLTDPPTIAFLLLKVRTEEARRREKKLRLKARVARSNVVSATEGAMATQLSTLTAMVQQLNTRVDTVSSNFASVASAQATPAAALESGGRASDTAQAYTQYQQPMQGVAHGGAPQTQGDGRGAGKHFDQRPWSRGPTAESGRQRPAGNYSSGRGERRSAGRGAGRSSRFGFCFNCGQTEHYQGSCTNPCNPVLVQQRLALSASEKLGQDQGN